jgi:flagellar hook-associated protein 3 FlgL
VIAMSLSSISTAYLGAAMIPTINQAQAQLTQLETESTTGQYADLGLQLGGQAGYELSLKNQNNLMQTLTAANNIAVTNLSSAQTAIGTLISSGNASAQGLAAWTPGAAASGTLQTLGQNGLQQLVATANTSVGDEYIFGGINGSTAPLAGDYASTGSAAQTAIDSAFQSTFGFAPSSADAANISSTALQSFLGGPFADLFTGADGSSASSTNTSAEIAPGQSIQTSTNANAAGFQELAQGYAMLSAFGSASFSASTQQALATAATSLINSGVSSLTATSASLGAAQSQVTQANASMSSQMSILQTQIGNLDDVDAASIATQLNSLQTQIETAYQLTAQLQKLSLAQYLPT